MKVGLVPNSRSSVDSLTSGGTASPRNIWCHCYRGHNPPIKKTSNVLTSQSALAWLGGKTMLRRGAKPKPRPKMLQAARMARYRNDSMLYLCPKHRVCFIDVSPITSSVPTLSMISS